MIGTDRLNCEIERIQQEYRDLYETAPVGYHEIDPEGVIQRVNQTEADMLGYSKDEMIGRPIYDFIVQRDLSRQAIAEKMSQPMELDAHERQFRRKDGAVIDVHVRDRQIFDQRGRVIGIRSTLEDITQRKRAEQRELMLRQAQADRQAAEQANQAKDQFLAILSHELRTPLTPVLVAASELESRPDLPADAREELATIRRNVQLQARLIDDLLDVTRIARGKMRLERVPTDVHAALHSALDICRGGAAAKHVRIEPHLQAARTVVNGDAARLQQVFWNLLKNAIKFTPDGGRIVVRTWNAEGDDQGPTVATLPAEHSGSWLVVEVTDTGIGIDADTLPRIFDAFEQGEHAQHRRFGGLGLGLAISKSLVEAHHGDLRAASAGKGQGATFVVQLPVVTESPTQPAPPMAAPPAKTTQQLRILLVDDDEDTLRLMSKLLQRVGHKVTAANSVASATRAADAAAFDMMIADLGLPDGNGLELMLKLRGRACGIALSGFGSEEDQQRSREAGFAAHLIKPVDIGQLMLTVQRVAGSCPPADSSRPS